MDREVLLKLMESYVTQVKLEQGFRDIGFNDGEFGEFDIIHAVLAQTFLDLGFPNILTHNKETFEYEICVHCFEGIVGFFPMLISDKETHVQIVRRIEQLTESKVRELANYFREEHAKTESYEFFKKVTDF